MNPDELVRWYYRMRDSFGAPALNPVDSTGRVYAPRCYCGSRTRHCRSDGEWVCGHCGQAWGYVDRHIFKGEVQKSIRPDTFERRHARWIDVGVQLYNFLNDVTWRRDARLFVAYAMGFTLIQLEDFVPIKKSQISDRIIAARREFSDRLATAGIRCS